MPLTAERLAYLLLRAIDTQSSADEGALARDFISKHAGEYDNFDFQKRVGHGQQLVGDHSEAARQQWYYATMRRVDVVGYRGNVADLIECKQHIDGAAVRQITDYAGLWTIRPVLPPRDKLIVCGRSMDPGVPPYAEQLGVIVEVLPAPSTPSAS